MPNRRESNSEDIRRLWEKYFADISLTDTRWFENKTLTIIAQALEIAAKNRAAGKEFKTLDEQNIGRYVNGIIRNLENGVLFDEWGCPLICEVRFRFLGHYKITLKDKERFDKSLQRNGECQLFNGAQTTGSYRRFWVNRRSIHAHFFAFFSEIGYLPAPKSLGGVNGLQVAHSCAIRSCCNPRHLRLTTKDVNLIERVYDQVPARELGDYGRDSICSPKGMPCDKTNGLIPSVIDHSSIQI